MAQRSWAAAASAPSSSSSFSGGCSATSESSSDARAETPAIAREQHAPGGVDANTFAFEANSLRDSGAVRAPLEAQLPLRIDHAMPRHGRAWLQRAERVADE